MLSSISWQEYLLCTGGAVLLYYLVIGLKLYQGKLRVLVPQQSRSDEVPINGLDLSSIPVNVEAEEVDRLMERVKEVFEMTGSEKLSKQEVEDFLVLVFSDFDSLQKSGLKGALCELIASEAQKVEGLDFNPGRVEELWDRSK